MPIKPANPKPAVTMASANWGAIGTPIAVRKRIAPRHVDGSFARSRIYCFIVLLPV